MLIVFHCFVLFGHMKLRVLKCFLGAEDYDVQQSWSKQVRFLYFIAERLHSDRRAIVRTLLATLQRMMPLASASANLFLERSRATANLARPPVTAISHHWCFLSRRTESSFDTTLHHENPVRFRIQ